MKIPKTKIEIKKYDIINVTLLFVGILLGILIIGIAQYKQEDPQQNERNNTFHFLSETSLIIRENQALYQDYIQTKESLSESKNSFEANKKAQEEAMKLSALLGKQKAYGPGTILSIGESLPAYLFTDIINDLYTFGAEAISINDIRIDYQSNFSENSLTKQVFISSVPISAPYTFKVIGNAENLYQILSKKNSTIRRLIDSFGIGDKIEVKKETNIELSI